MNQRELFEHQHSGTQVPDGYDKLMRKCFAYKANRRPLIDVVRDTLQDLLEKAAELDREKTPTDVKPSRVLFEMTMQGNDDEETKSSDSSKIHPVSSKTAGSSQGGSVQIEMGTLA